MSQLFDELDELGKLFRSLLNSPGASLYSFQQRLALSLYQERSVILRAPTGAGKTWAVLLPFIYSHKVGSPFADRALYALPLRALATQLYSSTREACERAGLKADTGFDVTIQTGERQDDPFFQGRIVFTTIDQLLSSYLFSPVSLPRRLGNINVGALPGSLVIFDEFHLLDPERSMGTAIEMLDRVQKYSQFVLMTATLSDGAVALLSRQLGAEVIEPDEPERAEIENAKSSPTLRRWEFTGEALTAQAVFAKRKQRNLVLLNTVSRAQKLYLELAEAAEKLNPQERPEVCLLHSRFFRADRVEKEKEVVRRLGKRRQAEPESFVLVSTQVVEAGMDFSADVLHTELAPANSLIQRAGRCARYGGEGQVCVYAVERAVPYSAGVAETEAALKRRSGLVLTAADEQEMVNEALGPYEERVLFSYTNLYTRRNEVNKAMDGLTPNAGADLIRDVDSVNVVVTSEPERICFDPPELWPETLSVPTGVLRQFLKKALPPAGSEWVAAVPQEVETGDDEVGGLRFRWQPVTSAKDGLPWLVAIHPAHARYSGKLGLVLGADGDDPGVRYQRRDRHLRYRFHCEPYHQHIRLVGNALERLVQESGCARRRLAKGLGLTPEMVGRAARLTAPFHDVGKLSTAWQAWARRWQEDKSSGNMPTEPLAHTDFDPDQDIERQTRFPSRPPHATEGAYAVYPYLAEVFADHPEVGVCVLTVIARHHGAQTKALKDFSLISSAPVVVSAALEAAGMAPVKTLRDRPPILDQGPDGNFARALLAASREEDQDWLPLYWWLVRLLRLADQAGTAEGVKST